MPIEIRVTVPRATVSESSGAEENPNTAIKNVPQTKHVKSRYRGQRNRPRPASAPVTRRAPVQVVARPHDVTMHVASIYDVDKEHHDIMGKALQAYHHHRSNEVNGNNKRQISPQNYEPNINATTNNTANTNNINLSNLHHHNHRQPPLSPSSSSNDGSPSPTSSSSSSSLWRSGSSSSRRGFKLALCTLKDALGQEPTPMPHTHSSPGPGFLPLQRPWSATPSGRLDAIREVSLANNVRHSIKTTRPVHQHRLHVGKPALSATMDPARSRSFAHRPRNATTQPWPHDSGLAPDFMTMSCPNARSLDEHMRDFRSAVPRDPNPSPVVMKGGALVSPSSPQWASRDRPSSAYSYDGGLFLSAGGSTKDFFFVHPDWVGQAITVQKLSLNERHSRPQSRTSGPASGGRAGYAGNRKGENDGRYRRCKSAPPAKYRNPVSRPC